MLNPIEHPILIRPSAPSRPAGDRNPPSAATSPCPPPTRDAGLGIINQAPDGVGDRGRVHPVEQQRAGGHQRGARQRRAGDRGDARVQRLIRRQAETLGLTRHHDRARRAQRLRAASRRRAASSTVRCGVAGMSGEKGVGLRRIGREASGHDEMRRYTRHSTAARTRVAGRRDSSAVRPCRSRRSRAAPA